MTNTRPEIKLRPNKSPRNLRHGFPWAYSNEIVLDRRARNIEPGSVITLVDAEQRPVAACAFNPDSRIACRVLDRNAKASIDADWFERRVKRALELRNHLYTEPFYRLIHAEADGFPGLIVDRFGETLVVQPNAAWIDQRLDMLVAALAKLTGAINVVINGSGRARRLEGLPDETGLLQGQVDGPLPVRMNGATYMADLLGGQKTGLYFDQRANQAFAARLARRGRVLDVFSHVGGFSLAALAGGASSALAVDGSQAALDLAVEGAGASGFADKFDTRRGDAFEVMAGLGEENTTFDVVICDPPAFAPARPALDAGLRAYERVARLAARLVSPGGYLGLCSCSHAADLASFRAASLRGVARGGRTSQIIHTGFAGPDHPVHPQLAESAYLKAIFLRLP
ncbi:MAG: class I SAM-dependent rRNA methyltransferase [Rhodobacteraceae bacterium]|nr:class I SAM-dependent rRNA methyltransferase [Paracoccaceae bacterium]